MQAAYRSLYAIAAILLSSILLAGCRGPNLFERMGNFWAGGCIGVLIIILNIIAIVEVAGSPRTTGNKVLWILLIVFFPVLGLIIYYFVGRR
jgi:hypothetical protein